MNLQRFWAIVKKEFIQIRRDKFSMRIPIIMPIMMLILFGYAVKPDVDNITLAVFDQNKTQESREYVDKFRVSTYFIPEYQVSSENELVELIESGRVKAGIIIPPDYTMDLKKNKTPRTQLIIDGSDPTTARTAMNSGIIISQMYSLEQKQKFLAKRGASGIQSSPGIDLATKVWYNPNLESAKFNVPGLIGLILQNITVMLTAFALVREKERSTIEQLIVTPVKSSELILGKMIPYILIGYTGFLFTFILGSLLFNVPVAGSISLLLLLGLLFVIVSLAMGMLISTIAKNQLQAMQMTILIILPSVILSGFMFPRAAMPWIISAIGYFLPLTYFLDIARGIILKGIGIQYLWPNVLALLIFMVVLLSIATLRFKKSLD
ncbi:MAG: ABC transporter permease [Ignavibacteriales bacterium]